MGTWPRTWFSVRRRDLDDEGQAFTKKQKTSTGAVKSKVPVLVESALKLTKSGIIGAEAYLNEGLF